MMQWDRLTLGRIAKELGFPRDTLEKVCRLADVLKFMESDELLSEGIALKGGTAINLTIFDLHEHLANAATTSSYAASVVKGIRQYADAPTERVSLKAKLEVMKAKVAGEEKPGKQMDKGKEVTI